MYGVNRLMTRGFMEFKCKICGKEYNGLNPVGKHLKDKHGLNVKEYYDKFMKKDFEGKCLFCGKETSFHRMSKGYQKYCSNSCQNKYEFKINYKGKADHKKEKEEIELRKHNECVEKYGEDNKSTRIKLSWIGRDNKTNSPEFIKNIEQKYGVKYYCQTEQFKKDKELREFNIFKSNTDTKDIVIIERDLERRIYKAHCYKCNKDFEISFEHLSYRKKKNIYYCVNCCQTKEAKTTSLQEKDLVFEISKLYKNEIITNDRKVISPKELDIWLPDIRLAIEYNGDYWHANPNRFKPTDIVHGEKAENIWYNDKEKLRLCEQNNIHCIVVTETEWKTEKQKIINKIQNYINILLGEMQHD